MTVQVRATRARDLAHAIRVRVDAMRALGRPPRLIVLRQDDAGDVIGFVEAVQYRSDLDPRGMCRFDLYGVPLCPVAYRYGWPVVLDADLAMEFLDHRGVFDRGVAKRLFSAFADDEELVPGLYCAGGRPAG